MNSDIILMNLNYLDNFSSNATKRKKKKPTSFIPPPNLNLQPKMTSLNINENIKQHQPLQPQIISNGPVSIVPFWRQPLPRNSMIGGSSETEGRSLKYSTPNVLFIKLISIRFKELIVADQYSIEIARKEAKAAGRIENYRGGD